MASYNNSCYLDDAGDPDVAGLGVVIAFLITVFLAAVIIIALYFRRGLAPSLYNSIDDSILLHLNKMKGQQPRDKNDPLNEALRDFLFTLSDQQLAAGLSLTVVVYIRFAQADIFSTYSFQMATTTIFMSCLTHMSTLAALPDKFPGDGGHIPRLIAMILLAVLMIPILIISNLPPFVTNPQLSCKCAWKMISSGGGLGNVYAGISSAAITMMIIFAYESKIKAVLKPPPTNSVGWYI